MSVYLSDNYLPAINLATYKRYMSNKFPDFYQTFKMDDPDTLRIINEMNRKATDFEGHEKGGRGDAYRRAQINPLVRIIGIKQLLQLTAPTQDIQNLPSTCKILDVLGGDGTLARAFNFLQGAKKIRQPILTGDIAEDMITQALRYHLPAIRQPAQYLFLKENTFDAVMLAYGTHHISRKERLAVCQEAFRILKNGGKLVIHDFEENSPIAHWFNKVVDKYSLTGHKFPHFTMAELQFYLQKSGFKKIKISHLYDPFIIADIKKQSAYEKLMDYVLNMYGLEKIKNGQNIKAAHKKVYHLIQKYIHYDYTNIKDASPDWQRSLTFFEKNGRFVAEMPRVALVGVGTK